MRRTNLNRRILKMVFTLVALLYSCSMSQQQSPATDKQTYIDATLQFSVSYPQSWAPFLKQYGHESSNYNSVVWKVGKEGGNYDLSMQVISMLSTEYIPEAQPADILFDIFPNLNLVSRSGATLGNSQAEKIDGYTPHKNVRAWILRSSLRDYLLIFTASPESFIEKSGMFDDIAQSFVILP